MAVLLTNYWDTCRRDPIKTILNAWQFGNSAAAK